MAGTQAYLDPDVSRAFPSQPQPASVLFDSRGHPSQPPAGLYDSQDGAGVGGGGGGSEGGGGSRSSAPNPFETLLKSQSESGQFPLPCPYILCYAVLCCAVLCYAMLCYAILCYAVRCHAVPYHAVLCCVMLSCCIDAVKIPTDSLTHLLTHELIHPINNSLRRCVLSPCTQASTRAVCWLRPLTTALAPAGWGTWDPSARSTVTITKTM